MHGHWELSRAPFWPATLGHAAFFKEIGADEAGLERFIGGLDAAVGDDYPDAGTLRVAQHRVPARLDQRSQPDGVDLLRDE